MSYIIQAYLVDLMLLHQACGSADRHLIATIEHQCKDTIAELNQWLDEDIDIPVPSIEEVLHALINGTLPSPYTHAPYKEVLELLCLHFGAVLPNEPFEFLQSSGIKYIQDDPTMCALIFESPPPIDIPGMESETEYRVGHVSHEQAAKMLEEYNQVIQLHDSEEWEYRATQQFYNWLVTAIENQRGIVTFFK